MEKLRIYLLGTFRLYRDDVLLTSKDWQIRHARQLFKLLFTERGHTISADRIIDLLWPSSAEHAHKTLRSAVSILRTVLEPTREPQAPSRFVPRGSTGYMLQLPDDHSVWIDTIEFERLLSEAKVGNESPKKRKLLEAALQLYEGDYLAEDEGEYWTITERARLREHYFAHVLALMESYCKLECYNEAIAVGRHALTLDACREPLYPLIMQCQAMLGDTVGALQTFEQCRQELDRQLGIDPSPQTLALHTDLLQGNIHALRTQTQEFATRPPTRLSSKNSPLTLSSVLHKDVPERLVQVSLFNTYKEQFTWITRQLRFLKEERSRTRGPHVIACVGEMGIGKSFLLRNILQYAQKLHVSILATTCQAVEQGITFAAVAAMMKVWLSKLHNEELYALPRPILATLAHVLPELLLHIPGLAPSAFLSTEQMQGVLITAFVDAISALSTRYPLLIAIDDLQWIDEASLIVLHRLVHLAISTGGEGRSLLVVFAYRPEDIPENVALNTTLLSLRPHASFQELHLKHFSADEVGLYVRAHDAAHSLSAEHIYQVTQGNALLLIEAVRILLHSSAHYPHLPHPQDKNDAVINALTHSQALRNAVLARIAHLPQRAKELLEYAAIIQHPFPPTLLCSCLSVEDYKILDILLARCFFVEVAGDDHDTLLSFSHEIVAQVVYTDLSAIKRAQLHRYIADQLAAYYACTIYKYTAEIAFHYRCAGPLYQTQALHYEVQVESCLTKFYSPIR